MTAKLNIVPNPLRDPFYTLLWVTDTFFRTNRHQVVEILGTCLDLQKIVLVADMCKKELPLVIVSLVNRRGLKRLLDVYHHVSTQGEGVDAG